MGILVIYFRNKICQFIKLNFGIYIYVMKTDNYFNCFMS